MTNIFSIAFAYNMNKFTKENNLFSNKQKMDTFFNFIDLSFQLHISPIDEMYIKLNGYVDDVVDTTTKNVA